MRNDVDSGSGQKTTGLNEEKQIWWKSLLLMYSLDLIYSI